MNHDESMIDEENEYIGLEESFFLQKSCTCNVNYVTLIANMAVLI